MADESPESMEGLYTVRTRHFHHGETTKNLDFPDAMRLIQDRFEKTNGEVHYASIERQEK